MNVVVPFKTPLESKLVKCPSQNNSLKSFKNRFLSHFLSKWLKVLRISRGSEITQDLKSIYIIFFETVWKTFRPEWDTKFLFDVLWNCIFSCPLDFILATPRGSFSFYAFFWFQNKLACLIILEFQLIYFKWTHFSICRGGFKAVMNFKDKKVCFMEDVFLFA